MEKCQYLNVNMSNVTMTRLSSEGQDINTYLDGTLPFVFVDLSLCPLKNIEMFTGSLCSGDCIMTAAWPHDESDTAVYPHLYISALFFPEQRTTAGK